MASLPFLRERHQGTFNGTELVINRLGLPNPKFKIGDRVQHRYICDDELDKENHLKLIISRGIILWMIPDAKLKRWEYFVLWDGEKPEYFDCDLPYLDDDLEFARSICVIVTD